MKHYTVTLVIILLSASFLVHGQDGTLSAAASADLDPAGQETVSASTGEARDENGKAFFPVRNVDMDFQMRGSLRGDFPHGGKASAKFRMDDIRLNIEGRAGKKVYYRFRQSFTKDFNTLDFENIVSAVNYAFVKWHATPKTTFTFGKHVLALGGHEFDAVPVYVIQFSDFGSSLSSYQMGVSGEWHITPTQDLVFQVSNFRGVTDDEFYYGGLPEGVSPTNFPFIATANWNGTFLEKTLNLRYSASYGHQAAGKGVWLMSLGHSYRLKKWGAYLDFMWSRQGLDVSSILSESIASSDGRLKTMQNTEYFTTVGYLHFFISPSFMTFFKGAWECGGVYSPYDSISQGLYRTNWNAQLCLQYMPTKDRDFRLFAHYNFYSRHATSRGRTLGMQDLSEHLVSLGIIYIMNVL